MSTTVAPERTASPSLNEELYVELMRLASSMAHSTARFIGQHGITSTQYNILRILRGAQPAGLSRNALSSRLITPMPDVSRLLDRMEAAGWIERERSQQDRRQVSTCITASGLFMLAHLDEPVRRFHLEQTGAVAEDAVQELTRLLRLVRQQLPASAGAESAVVEMDSASDAESACREQPGEELAAVVAR